MMFDPNAFLETQTTDANSTQTVPVPAGEYTGLVDKVEAKPWAKKDDPSVSGLKLLVTYLVDDAGVKELLGRDKVTVRQDIMLDLTEAGAMDMGKGKNVGLGRLREACGLNAPGQPFSPTMLVGRMVKVNVQHRVDGENIYAEVKGVARM